MKSTWDQERRKKNGKRLKLVIANLPTGSPIRVRRTRRIHPEFALKVKEPRHEAGAWFAFGGKADMTFCDAHVCF
jgi:hypothetical protein